MSWASIQNDSVLPCRRGYFLAFRACLYIRTEIKVTLETHELRFIVLKLHYLCGYSWMGFLMQELMDCLLAYVDLNRVMFIVS